tara:strand:- start:4615 stop:5010 length:396 start_codon:yes stop_codon:yes gene_type:complete
MRQEIKLQTKNSNLEIGTWVTIMVYDWLTNRNKYKSKKIVSRYVHVCGSRVSYNGGMFEPNDIIMIGRPTKKQKQELSIKEDIRWEEKQKQEDLKFKREVKIDRLKKMCSDMFKQTSNDKYLHLMLKLYKL